MNNFEDVVNSFSKPARKNLRIDELLSRQKNAPGTQRTARNSERRTAKASKKNSLVGVSRLSKKIKKVRKLSFNRSQTGKNLSKLRANSITKKKKMAFLEDDSSVFTAGQHFLEKTINQKNDNDIDSEPEIIRLGVKYLHSKLVHSIVKEREVLKTKAKIRKARRFQSRSKAPQIPEYFAQAPCFNTPSDRRVSINDRTYLHSIISSQQPKPKFQLCSTRGSSQSKALAFPGSQNKSSSRFWVDAKNKTSMLTMATEVSSQGVQTRSRRGSGIFLNGEVLKTSIGSMFMNSPHIRKC